LILFLSISTQAIQESNKRTDAATKSIQSQQFESEIIIGNVTSIVGKILFEIKNIGSSEATNIAWEVSVQGGVLNLIDTTSTGSISTLTAGETTMIETNTILGFGEIKVDISVGDNAKSVQGSILLFFIAINPDFTANFDIIADGFNSPIYLTHANDGSNRLFVVDQIGKIYIIKNGELLSQPFLDITNKVVDLDITYDERGLLGMAFHPNFESNNKFYVYYSTPKMGEGINHETVLSEYIVSSNPDLADESSERILFRVDQPEANHNGGQLLFGPDGYLYLGLGDGGGAGDQHGTIGNGQNKNTVLGSIIRIDVNTDTGYDIPSDNPLVGSEGKNEIYAYGFRNPWRFSLDRETNQIFVADVGQDEWEEINILKTGGNFGWRILEGTHPYDLDLADLLEVDIATLTEPIHEYSHSLGRSITGGYVYRGSENPELYGKYVFGDWSSSFVVPRGSLFYLDETTDGSWQRYNLVSSNNFNRFILSFGEDENGELYVLSKTNLGPTGTSGDVRKIIIE